MSFKYQLNSTLQAVTGYRLTREPLVHSQDEVAREEAERREAEERAARRARGDDLPRHFDDEVRETIARVRPRTMTSPVKLQMLIEATRYVSRYQVPGEIVECGVWRGGGMQAVAFTLRGVGDANRHLHLFDTFEGMPPPTEHDARTREGVRITAEELLAKADKGSWTWARADLADVQQAMEETGYSPDLVHFHPGLVEETTPGEVPERIALLRLDTDWYESTRHELEHIYSRLSPGGVLIIDDYSSWDGAQKATEEWLTKTGEPLFLAPMGTGRIAIKPRG